MAAKTLYLLDSLASGGGYMALQDGGSAPSAATTGTGWTVAKIASGNYARMDAQTERASGAFTTTAQPNGAPDNTLGDCMRSSGTINGTFAATAWTIPVPVVAVGAGGTQDGNARVRVWRSANADGSSATELTAATQVGTTVTNLAVGTPQTSTVTWTPAGVITLTSEYLFIQLAWQITGAGGNNSCDVLLRVGTGITTSNFTAGAEFIDVSGIATGEAFGTAAVAGAIDVSGVATAEAFGSVAVAAAVDVPGVASGETFGTVALDAAVDVSGVATGEAFGAVTVEESVGGSFIDVASISSDEAWGSIGLTASIDVASIASLEGFGAVSLAASIDLTGITSGESFGAVVLDDGTVIEPGVSFIDVGQQISVAVWSGVA